MAKYILVVGAIAAALCAVLAAAPDKPIQSAFHPSLGLNIQKGVSPIVDEDALVEENRIKKTLPGNEFVEYKRGLHETALLNSFLEGFKDSPECSGITFFMHSGKKAEFTVQISVVGHDKHPGDETWTWMLLRDDASDKSKNGMGGLGTQSSAKLTARDVCLTIWDDIDPNHFPKPGGRIE